MEHLLYTRLARYYDFIYRGYLECGVPRLIDAVEEVFRQYTARRVRDVVDVGCGTGGPTLELARRGYRVVGVDLHEEMLEIARRKAEEQGVEVEFIVGDARGLDKLFEPESFDAATMFFSAINYMTTVEDLSRLLSSVRTVLRPGGVFVADAGNPYDSFYRLGSRGEGVAYVWDTEGPDGERLVMHDWREVVDWARGIIRFKRLITVLHGDGEARVFLMSDTLRLYTITELELVALQSGFQKAVGLCYSRGELMEPQETRECSRIVIVAVK